MKQVAILTFTLNPSLPIFIQMLDAVQRQDYKGNIRHFILDGGSTNGCIGVAKQYGCICRQFPFDVNEGSNRTYPALQWVHEEICIILQSDNIPPNSHWISEMVNPFRDPQIIATFPMYNTYWKGSNLLTRYTALIGSPDPTLFYLGKSDKIPMSETNYMKGHCIQHAQHYDKVRFTPKTLPTLGDNGFAVRTSILKKVTRPNQVFYHTDKYMELLYLGYDTYGVVKNSIIHVTKTAIGDLVRRRVAVKEQFTDNVEIHRLYRVFDPHSPRDLWNLGLYVIYSMTFIEPFIRSIRGYLIIHDIAWFLHPILCFCMVCAYGWSEVKRIGKHVFRRV